MGFMDKVKDVSKDLGEKAQGAFDSKMEQMEADKQARDELIAIQKELKKTFAPTKKMGNFEIDMENELFKVKNATSGIKKQDGKMAKMGKGLLAVSTVGMSSLAFAVANAIEDKIFRFDEVIDYELLEDDTQVTKGGLGAAVAGGVLLGGIGAMVGGMTGKRKTKKSVDSLYLKLTLNDLEYPCVMVPFITKTVKTKSSAYVDAYNKAQESISCLNIILKKLEADQANASTTEASDDPVEQVKKMKELLDMGVITEEEFETKKKEILGL